MRDVGNLGGMLVKSFSVGRTHSVSQVTFFLLSKAEGARQTHQQSASRQSKQPTDTYKHLEVHEGHVVPACQ